MIRDTYEPIFREVLPEGRNFFDQTPFTGIIRDLPVELSNLPSEAVRISMSKVARELQKPIWDTLVDLRSEEVMIEMRQSMISKALRSLLVNKGTALTLNQARNMEIYLEESLGEYPHIFEYISEHTGGSDTVFLQNGERGKKLLIGVPEQPTYVGWLKQLGVFENALDADFIAS